MAIGNCHFCQKEFSAKPYKLRQTRFYCSAACRHASLKRSHTEPCAFCGEAVTRRRSGFRRGGAKQVFCGRICSAHWRSANPSRIRFCSSIKPHQRDIYGRACAICGFDRYVEYCHVISAAHGGTIHPTNIIPLCPNHHSLMDNELLNPKEQAICDGWLIQAWASPQAARFEKGNLQ